MNSIKLRSYGATIVAAIMMGTLGWFVRSAGVDAAITAFFRYAIGFAIMGLIVLTPVVMKKRKLLFSPSSFFSGMAISLCILFYFLAIEQMNIGLAAFIVYLGPVFAIIGEALIRRKLPAAKQFVIIGLALTGFLLISSLGGQDGGVKLDSGLILALLSGLSYGGYILINRLIPEQVTLNVRVFWQFTAAVVTIGVALIFRNTSFEGFSTGWPYLLFVGVVQGFVGLILTSFAIKHLTSIEYGSLSYIEPLVAVLVGFLLYDETLGAIQLIGIGLIVAATLLQCIPIGEKTKL